MDTSMMTRFVVFVCMMVLTYAKTVVNNTMNVTATPPQEGSGGLNAESVAALWAGFLAGMVCIFGFGMLFYDFTVRKYQEWYPHTRLR